MTRRSTSSFGIKIATSKEVRDFKHQEFSALPIEFNDAYRELLDDRVTLTIDLLRTVSFYKKAIPLLSKT